MRNSPSGPLAVSDEISASLLYSQAVQPTAPGDYFAVFVAGVAGQFIPIGDPLAPEAALFAGAKTRAGRILRARISLLANQNTSGNGDIDFQWLVNNQPVGKLVTLKWSSGTFVTDINAITVQQAINAVRAGSQVDFGEPAWVANDVVILKATVKGPIAPGSLAAIPFTFETTYEH